MLVANETRGQARIAARGYAVVVCALLQWLPQFALAQASAHAVPDDAVYGYTDDRGRLVYAQRLSDIPAALRQYARRVDVPAQPAPGAAETVTDTVFSWVDSALPGAAAPAGVVYRYRGPNGRVTFTNLPSSVPVQQRQTAALDLAHISLNSQLGRDLDQRLKQRFDRLVESPYCAKARATLDEPFWKRLWREHPALVYCAAAALLLLLMTPRMAEWVGGAPWARVLSTSFSLLAVAALLAFVFVQSKRTLAKLEERAAPCDVAAWGKAEHAEQPLVQRLNLVKQLELQTRAIEQVHAEAL